MSVRTPTLVGGCIAFVVDFCDAPSGNVDDNDVVDSVSTVVDVPNAALLVVAAAAVVVVVVVVGCG